MALEGTTQDELHKRFEWLKGAEHHKNELITELLSRLDGLNNEHQQTTLDHQREIQFNRDGQKRERDLREEVRKYKSLMSRDPFILVLLDGDGMIFEDDMIRKGELGGKEAAAELWNDIKDYVHEKLSEIPADCRIVARIYANLKGLADVCYRTRIVDSPSLLEEFYRGFTGSKILFDFIDVGPGKDRADEKITELFKLHLTDFRCQHIFFGCSHDNGYTRLLEQYTEPAITNRITLVEGVPFERELSAMKARYSTVKFEHLFRTIKIDIYNLPPPPSTTSHTLQHQAALSSSATGSLPPPQNGHPLAYQQITTAPSASPAPGPAVSMNPKAQTWASTALSAPQAPSPPPNAAANTVQPAGSMEVPTNRYGQRIDPPTVYDKEEINRVRNYHLCNVHYLRHDCPWNPCGHKHDQKITKKEFAALTTLARMVPCYYGSDCDDPKCMYGHSFFFTVLTSASPLAPITLPPSALALAQRPSSVSATSPAPSLGTIDIECDGEEYGHNLRYDSCEELIKEQMHIEGPETFKPRGQPGALATYPTPFLFSSGKSKNLGLIMRSYEPQVTCGSPLSHTPAVPEWFELLFRSFPASKNPRLFGTAPLQQGVTQKLPWEASGPREFPKLLRPLSEYLRGSKRAKCTRISAVLPNRKAASIYVTTNSPRVSSSWFDIYAGITAAWAMCGARGSSAIAKNIGKVTPIVREAATGACR
ncbi:MAG: hypothetical protein Q9220_000723 [cf. Caloplaca sp. 1 TL-2023]